MAQHTMNEYRITFQNKSEVTAVRDCTKGVTNDFESVENPIVQIQRTRTDLNVYIPDDVPPIYFSVNVTPQAAKDAACIAAPRNFTVPSGTPVLFEAITSDGYVFVGWFLTHPVHDEDEDFSTEIPISTEEKTTIIITAPEPGQERVIEARFAPD